MSLAPKDIVSAHPWQRATFTTYALSLSFFEAVVLDALVRGKGKQALILADVQGLRASLSEQGAQRVGKDYEVEPVAVKSGVFHPKVTVLSGDGACHMLVGSGNLTFNGWGGNCEILEHLHPSFAADAFLDASRFFELLSSTERVRHGAKAHCDETAADLRAAAEGQPRNGEIRFFHNLHRSISEQLIEIARDLGGATRLIAAAPFWDKGAAIDGLAEALSLDSVYIHAHEFGTVEGTAGANWPESCRSTVHPVRLDVMKDGRRLHAKAFEIMCRRGRVVVSGSANATNAALGIGHNVEACVIRIQRERATGWTFIATERPEPQAALDDENDNEAKHGILRAVLDAEIVRGQVLTPKMHGPVRVYYISSDGEEPLGDTTLSEEGGFEIAAPKLEQKSWLGGRLVIRVIDGQGRRADGFVSVASFAEIKRHIGPVAGRFLALLAGNETPADIAAVMSWCQENPGWYSHAVPLGIGGGGKGDAKEKPVPVIVVAELSDPAVAAARAVAEHKTAGSSFARFMEAFLAALRQNRGSLINNADAGDDDDEDDGENKSNKNGKDRKDKNREKQKKETERAVQESFANFEKISDRLLKPGGNARQALIAFDLTQYVCRLEPEDARLVRWLNQIIKTLLERGVPPERRDDVAASILTLLGASAERKNPRWARVCLSRLGFDLSGHPPSSAGVQGFQSVLPQHDTFAELWKQVQSIRTYQEQVRAYLDSLAGKAPTGDFFELKEAAKDEWRVMENALKLKDTKRIILCAKAPAYCPHCNIALPAGEAGKLQSIGIATAKSCCQKILICTGD